MPTYNQDLDCPFATEVDTPRIRHCQSHRNLRDKENRANLHVPDCLFRSWCLSLFITTAKSANNVTMIICRYYPFYDSTSTTPSTGKKQTNLANTSAFSPSKRSWIRLSSKEKPLCFPTATSACIRWCHVAPNRTPPLTVTNSSRKHRLTQSYRIAVLAW